MRLKRSRSNSFIPRFSHSTNWLIITAVRLFFARLLSPLWSDVKDLTSVSIRASSERLLGTPMSFLLNFSACKLHAPGSSRMRIWLIVWLGSQECFASLTRAATPQSYTTLWLDEQRRTPVSTSAHGCAPSTGARPCQQFGNG